MVNKSFFFQKTEGVAKKLLGKKIVREIEGVRVTGIISETEAYLSCDSACHAYNGKTKRNAPMFETGGIAYVYIIYGIYHMLNFVTEKKGAPSAVLIRGVIPLENIELMKKFRNIKNSKNLSNGPGKLCKAFNIDKSLNGHKLFMKEKLWVEEGESISLKEIKQGRRVGIDYAKKIDREAYLRFWI